ncbi:MAG: hypothetical protein K6T83_11745 [Alicyclobacillus sp.]|nr:hypothetical protein [Alicyclobacillus sp.]
MLDANTIVGLTVTAIVFFLLLKVLAPKPSVKLQFVNKRKQKKRRVEIDPLVARERRLAAELRVVRAQLRSRELD